MGFAPGRLRWCLERWVRWIMVVSSQKHCGFLGLRIRGEVRMRWWKEALVVWIERRSGGVLLERMSSRSSGIWSGLAVDAFGEDMIN